VTTGDGSDAVVFQPKCNIRKINLLVDKRVCCEVTVAVLKGNELHSVV
jgi:hypothetical protein